MTSAEIKAILKKKYTSPGWVFLDELRLGTGYASSSNRYMDGFAIYTWGDLETKAFEIKVSRSDFLLEMKKPSKRRQALAFSNKFYFVTPPGLLKPEEIPSDSGLIEVRKHDGDDQLKIVVHAPNRERIRPTWTFVASVMRRIAETL